MKRTALVSKGTMKRLLVQVQEAWNKRDLKKCIEGLEQLIRLNPTDVKALQQLGRMHGLLYDYSSATKCFDRACQLVTPDKRAIALAAAGQQARDFYDPSVTESYFDRAVNERGVTPDILVQAAEVAERGRRMEEASRLVERAFELDARHAGALLANAHLSNRAGKLEEAERLLQPLLEITIKPDVRIKAWYELGAVLDRQARYDEAMKAFLKAKALLRHDGGALLTQRRTILGRYERFRADINEDTLRQWNADRANLEPQQRLALLGGHPRSGTTLLEQVLDAHPDIVSMEETNNYGDYVGTPLTSRLDPTTPFLESFNSVPAELLSKVRDDYRTAAELCIGAPLGGRLLIDKHPSLTISIPGMSRVFPEIRFLIALRDPRDVVLSCFMQPFFPLGDVNAMFLSLETTTEEYAALMGMWLKVKPILPNPHLEVRYEDMVEDLEAVARRVLVFLEVPWDERVLGFDEHASKKRVRSPTYADVTQKVFKRARGRWRNYEKYLTPHLVKLEPFLKAFGYE